VAPIVGDSQMTKLGITLPPSALPMGKAHSQSVELSQNPDSMTRYPNYGHILPPLFWEYPDLLAT